MKNKKEPIIENAIIIAKFSDGKCRQVLANKDTINAVLQIVGMMEGNINVLETPIETIDIEVNNKTTLK